LQQARIGTTAIARTTGQLPGLEKVLAMKAIRCEVVPSGCLLPRQLFIPSPFFPFFMTPFLDAADAHI
jgi:hypothetical protein